MLHPGSGLALAKMDKFVVKTTMLLVLHATMCTLVCMQSGKALALLQSIVFGSLVCNVSNWLQKSADLRFLQQALSVRHAVSWSWLIKL